MIGRERENRALIGCGDGLSLVSFENAFVPMSTKMTERHNVFFTTILATPNPKP